MKDYYQSLRVKYSPFSFSKLLTSSAEHVKSSYGSQSSHFFKLFKVGVCFTAAYSTYGMLNNLKAYAESKKTPKNLQNTEFNKSIIDLSDKHLVSSDLEYVLSKVNTNKFIGHIKWGSLPKDGEEYKAIIEEKVIANNQNYRSHPNDFVHGLLSSHVYYDVNAGDKVAFSDKHHNYKHNTYLDGWMVQKPYDNMKDYGGYYGASYIKDDEGYLVLAHRGTVTRFTDMFKTESPWKDNMIGVVGGNIVKQQIAAFIVTQEVVQHARDNNYNLSITGHSLGGWLAELSLMFCYKNFNYDISKNEVKAVTFDSPGSVMHMENSQSNVKNHRTEFDIKNLDITTYLSPPNPINSINKHLGKVYTVPTQIPETSSMIQLLLGRDNADKALVSVVGHSLNLILDTFNPKTGIPDEYKEVIDWPHIKAKLKNDNIKNSLKDAVSSLYNDSSTNAVFKNAIDIAAYAVPDVTIASIANVLLAYFRGDINTEQFFSCYKNKIGTIENPTQLERDTKSFYLAYQGHYELSDVNLYKDVLNDKNKGSADYYLAQLSSKNDKILEHELNSLVVQQLIALKSHYEIIPEDGKDKIVVKDAQITIDELREQIIKLMSFDSKIATILYQYSALASVSTYEKQYKEEIYLSNNKLQFGFMEPRDEDYIQRLLGAEETIFSRLDNILKKCGYALITAPGGSGKSSCVTEYAYRMKDLGTEVIFFGSDSIDKIYQRYIELANELKIPVEGQKKEVLIRMVNKELALKDKNLLFIFDNSKSYNEIKDYIDKLPTGAKYVITSRNNILVNNIDKFQHIELEPHFDNKSAKSYLQKALKNRDVTDAEIDLLLGTVIPSPLKLSLMVGWFYNEENKLKTVDKYIDLYKGGNFDKPEFTLLFDDLIHANSFRTVPIMQYVSYLDPDFISIEILKQLLHIDDNKLSEDIKHLQSQSLIKLVRKKETGEIGVKIHRDIQKDIIEFITRHDEQRENMSLKQTSFVYQQLSKVLSELMPKVNKYHDENWQVAKLIYPHAAKVLKLIDESKDDNQELFDQNNSNNILRQKAELLNKLGLYNFNIAYDSKAALQCYEEAELIYTDLGEKTKKAELLVNKGWCYFAMRKLSESEDSFNAALELITTDDTLKADALSGIAINYDKNIDGKKPDSLKSYLEAYEIYKKIYQNQDHAEIATALHDIGWYYREKGHKNLDKIDKKEQLLNKAIECFEASHAMRERLYSDKDHPDIASSLSSIATTYNYFGDAHNLKKALKLHEEALKMREELFHGQAHQDIINSYFRLGETHQALKNYGKSLEFFTKAQTTSYEIQDTYDYGPIIKTFQDIAGVYEEAGNITEATEYYKKGYSVIKRCNYNPNREENKKLTEKVKAYAPEFIDNSELRIFITNHGEFDIDIYHVKTKLQSKILDKLYEYSKNGQWESSWGNYGAKSYLSDNYIKKILGSNATTQNLEIAKELCFEAINLGIMSRSEKNRDFTCLQEFTRSNKELVQQIAKEHPEYFVDGTNLIKLAEENLISKDIICDTISSKELEYLASSQDHKATYKFESKNCDEIIKIIFGDSADNKSEDEALTSLGNYIDDKHVDES